MKAKSKKLIDQQAQYYETHDVFEVGDLSKMTVRSPKMKKINIGIPQSIYLQAKGLSELSGTGYQNILKMAMVIGLKNLSGQIKQ